MGEKKILITDLAESLPAEIAARQQHQACHRYRKAEAPLDVLGHQEHGRHGDAEVQHDEDGADAKSRNAKRVQIQHRMLHDELPLRVEYEADDAADQAD